MIRHPLAFLSAALLAAALPAVLSPTLAQSTPAAAKPAATAPAAAASIWRLPAAAGSMRIDGEAGSLAWPVYLPQASVAEVKRFQLTYKAAISVMPEASWLTLEINGKTVGHVPIAAPNRARTLSFDLPAGLLVTGWNSVRVSASQRHRVDCSIAATYELWTELDAGRTGFVGPRPKITTVEELPALGVAADGSSAIQLLLPKQAGLEHYSRAISVAERAALLGQYRHPEVDTKPLPGALRIAVGTAAELAEIPGLPGPGALRRPVELVASTDDGGPILVVSGPTGADVDRAVAELAVEPPAAVGTEEGLRTLERAKGLKVRPGEPITLAEAGIPTTAFSGRLFRASFDVLLPPDAYLGDYGEALLSFDGGYAAGLTREAVFLVQVNGVTAGVLSLDRPGGAALQGLIIHMPLNAFRPGRNRVEIEAQLPSRSDGDCDTLSSITAKERFLILGNTTLTLPRLARIAQFPGLSASFVGGFRVARGDAPTVYLPRATAEMAAVAATILANAAAQTGRPTQARLGRERPQAASGPALVVGVAADVPAPLLAAGGLDPALLEKAWRAGATGRSGSDVTGAFEDDADDAGRLDAWGEQVEGMGGIAGSALSLVEMIKSLASESLVAAGIIELPPTRVSVNADTSFVLSQGFLDGTPVTLAVGPDEAAMRAGVDALTRPMQLGRLDGRAATFSDELEGAEFVPARETRFFPSQPFSIDNTRLIAAGWLSSHAAWYIGAVLIVILFLGTSTWGALAYSRRRSPSS